MFNLGISDLLQQLCFASFAATVVALKSLFHLGERSDEVMHLLATTQNESVVQVAWNPRYADGIFLAIRAE